MYPQLKGKWFFCKNTYAPFFPFIYSSPARHFSGILMAIPIPTVYYSTEEEERKKKSQGIQPFRTYEKLCGRNFLWPSATGLKQKAGNTVTVVSVGVFCGILINQPSISFQILENTIWLRFLRNLEGKYEFICGIH